MHQDPAQRPPLYRRACYPGAGGRSGGRCRLCPQLENTQIARYILVEDAQKREKIASDCVLDFTYNANTLSHAPALVALTMVTGRLSLIHI